eukprot:scaffold21945_cov58-Skeletonema_marinoi.AAC.1
MKKTVKSSLEAMTNVSTSVIPDINGTLDDVASKRMRLASQMSGSFCSSRLDYIVVRMSKGTLHGS